MSDQIHYMVTNLLTGSGVSVSSSGVSATYPASYVYDDLLDLPMVFETAGSKDIVIDLGSAQALDTLLIGNHRFASTCTFSIKAGLTASPSTVVSSPAWTRDYIAADLGSITARYITITITGVLAEDWIGEIAVGTKIAFPGSWLLGRKIGKQHVQIVHKSIFNSKDAYRLANFADRDYMFRFNPSTQLADFETFDRTVQGMITRFWLIESLSTGKVWYGRKEENFEPIETDDRANPPRAIYRLSFEEESKGSLIYP